MMNADDAARPHRFIARQYIVSKREPFAPERAIRRLWAAFAAPHQGGRRRYPLEASRYVAGRVHIGIHEKQALATPQQIDDAGGLDAELVSIAEGRLSLFLGGQLNRFDGISGENSRVVGQDQNSGIGAMVQQAQGAEDGAARKELVASKRDVPKPVPAHRTTILASGFPVNLAARQAPE
ncbi:hypothetical protein [Mesorhizobium sp. B2-3-4]|uniref:hypothetical protein n=1 Tax=Mesorhizobium sp. B2-3-4 TaxID=2589959 RepID=UPI001FF00687|nr:hypothetical protein [Mesorhizobium sp. B2-3-4]